MECIMHGVGVEIVFDLGGATKHAALGIRDALLASLNSNDPNSKFSFQHGNLTVYSVGGTLVKIKFPAWGHNDESWRAYSGLSAVLVTARDGGNDHFPVAGIYHASSLTGRGISGASATVRWQSDHKFPLDEDTMASVVSSVRDGYGLAETVRLDVPVVFYRTWKLVLTAPTLPRAIRAYELLRGGVWKPTITFADALTDSQKQRLLTQTVQEGDED
jgi:hypothetical protein